MGVANLVNWVNDKPLVHFKGTTLRTNKEDGCDLPSA